MHHTVHSIPSEPFPTGPITGTIGANRWPRGGPVHLLVEIWPTSMVFGKGHRLRMDIQPRDGLGGAPYTHCNGDYNSGTNTLHMGGRHDSHLLLPIIPD